MKIYSASQLQKADKITLKRKGIESKELMEYAATKVFHWIREHLPSASIAVTIFCGVGNNGGDGLVVARLMAKQGYKVQVFIVCFKEARSSDFILNLNRLTGLGIEIKELREEVSFPVIGRDAWVVDAIFGIGLTRPVQGWLKDLMDHLNSSKAFIISVDVPSGLFCEASPPKGAGIVQSDVVLTFNSPKLSFFLGDTGVYLMSWEVLDIGLDQEFLDSEKPLAIYLDKSFFKDWLSPRARFSHKGNYGHVLLIGGSYGKMGAMILAARAAIKSGAGLTTAFIPKCGYQILQTSVPEVMVITDDNEKFVTELRWDFSPSAIGLGMGMGTEIASLKAFEAFLTKNSMPLVVDADALNLIAINKELLSKLPEKSILTPHPGELARLIGRWEDEEERLLKARAFAKNNKLILVIKGAYTQILLEDNVYINSTGNPGMATGGSGDTLTGIITALLGKGYLPEKAALLGVYLHGLAGDKAAEKVGEYSLIAGDIIAYLPTAFLELGSTI